MSAAHTPGPWHWLTDRRLQPVVHDPDQSAVHTILSEDGCFGYLGSDLDATIAEDEANRRLIAAAPDLLDAAQAAEAVLGRQKWREGSTDPEAVALFKLRGAIAKTTARFPAGSCSSCGESFGPGDEGFSHCADHAHLQATEA